MTIKRGQSSVGMSTLTREAATLPIFVINPETHLAQLEQRLQDMEILVVGKADTDRLRSLIAISDEAVLIQAKQIALVGEVTIADIIADQNGSASGVVHPSITRIVGDKIQTGTIYSNNFDEDNGSKFDLNNGTLMMGGSAAPKFLYENGDLTISGALTAESIVITGDSSTTGITLGELVGVAVSALTADELQLILNDGVGNIIAGATGDYGLKVLDSSIVAQHNLANPSGLGGGYSGDLRTGIIISANGIGMGHNRKSDGAWVNAISINSSGNATFAGGLSAATGTFAGSLSAASGTFNGDLSTSGQVLAIGSTTSGGYTASVVGDASNPSTIGVAGISDNIGVVGSAAGIGGYFQSGAVAVWATAPGGTALFADAPSGGTALAINSGKIVKANTAGHFLSVYDTGTNALVGQFRYEFS